MATGLKRIIENHEQSLVEGGIGKISFRYHSYCISNLRGGIATLMDANQVPQKRGPYKKKEKNSLAA